MNSIGTELTRDDRRKLYSNFGLLYPHGHSELASAEDFDQIRSAMEKCPPYQAIFNKVHSVPAADACMPLSFVQWQIVGPGAHGELWYSQQHGTEHLCAVS